MTQRRIALVCVLGAVGWLAPAAAANTIQVSTTSDDPVTSGCSLRDAITSANIDAPTGGCAAGSGTDTIDVPAGTYRLTHTGAGELNNATGDLNITAPVTISGAGPDNTTIDGNNTDRVFDIDENAGGTTIQDVTITHGHAPDGNPVGGTTVSIDPTQPVRGGSGDPGGAGGGILTDARLTLTDCVISGNTGGTGGAGGIAQGASGNGSAVAGSDVGGGGFAEGGPGGVGGSGGGISAHNTSLTITNCQVIDNTAGTGGNGGDGMGGNGVDRANADISQGLPNGGTGAGGAGGAGGPGGGISIDKDLGGSGNLTVTSSVIKGNTSGDGGSPGSGVGGNGGSAIGTGPGGNAGTTFGGSGGSGGSGGGIDSAVTTTITDSDISGNTAADGLAGAPATGSMAGNGAGSGHSGGGGGYVFGGGGGPGGSGAGVFSTDALTLDRVGLNGNQAGSGGVGGTGRDGTPGSPGGLLEFGQGGLANGGNGGAGGSGGGLAATGAAPPLLSDVTLDGNAAGSGSGGGGASDPADPFGIGGNGGSAGSGGAVDGTGGAIVVSRSTIVSNTLGVPGAGGIAPVGGDRGAAGTGGGIEGTGGTGASGTIFSANATPECVAVEDGGHDIVNPAAGGCPGEVEDPMLERLADNGGLSLTQAIPADSPAVDQYACSGLDGRGATRPAGGSCDVGAYEFAPPVASGESVQDGNTQVVVHASVIPNVSAQVSFEYGTSTKYGSSTPAQTVTGSGPQGVAVTVSGLQAHTTYHFRVRATNGDGSVTGSDHTFTTLSVPPRGGNPTAVSIALSGLKIKPDRFAVAAHAKSDTIPLGTTISYTLNQPAKVLFSFARQASGAIITRHHHRVCQPGAHAHTRRSRCSTYVNAGSFSRTATQPGSITIPFSGFLGRHPLPAGTYRLTVQASSGHERSHTITTTLKIVALPEPKPKHH